jgi:hypothetical protein
VLDQDYFTVDEEVIKQIEAELTIVGGNIVYAKGGFGSYGPEPLPILPDWSPTAISNGYYPANPAYRVTANRPATAVNTAAAAAQQQLLTQVHCCAGSCGVHGHAHEKARLSNVPVTNYTAFWGALGCSCFAF